MSSVLHVGASFFGICCCSLSDRCEDRRYLPGSIRRSFFLQQQVGDLDLSVLCSHMQGSEALLEGHRAKEKSTQTDGTRKSTYYGC